MNPQTSAPAAPDSHRHQPGRTPTPEAGAFEALCAPAPGATTARCIGRCDWTAGPGPAADTDKAADKHTRTTGHPTGTCTAPARRTT